jgi:hemerythrin-like domain-containing protein
MPLTHDHHHVLARVRRLKEAVDKGDEAELWRAAQGFVDFFHDEGELHFREEEEQLIPLFGDTLPPEAVTMLEDHVILKDLIRGLAHEANVAHVEPETAQRVAERFAAHVRFEEKVLFPMIERIASEAQLAEISLAERDRTPASS